MILIIIPHVMLMFVFLSSSTPPEIDEQPSDSDVETGVVLHQQEGEARRRKMELEAEERKLQETLEYQR